MRTRKLPKTDLQISVVGFGCWAIGKTYWGDDVDDNTSAEAVRAALDVGINWFDTAPLYGEGHADEVLVKALGSSKHEAIIATKVGVRFGGEGEHASSDLSPEWIREDTEASLKRLGLDAIDWLQVHWPCQRGTTLDDSIATLEALRSEGKIRYFGLCNYGADEVLAASRSEGMVSLQTPYSLLRRELEGPLLTACGDIGVVVYEPLCRGLLTGKFSEIPQFPETDMRAWDERFQGSRFHHARRLINDLERVGAKVGLPTSAIAIGWAIAQPGITAAIAGAKTPLQVQQNALASRVLDEPKISRVVDKIASIHGGE